jgi:hypothetical protein
MVRFYHHLSCDESSKDISIIGDGSLLFISYNIKVFLVILNFSV